MTRTVIYVLTTLVILIAGFMPCRSSECTRKTISSCRWDNVNRNDCEYFDRQVRCLEDIDAATCPDDKMAEKLNQSLARSREGADECPGLPEGICYFNAIIPCGENVPFEVIISRYQEDDEKKEQCQQFKGKEDASRDCYEAVKPKCQSKSVLKRIDDELEYIDKIQQKCSQLEQD